MMDRPNSAVSFAEKDTALLAQHEYTLDDLLFLFLLDSELSD